MNPPGAGRGETPRYLRGIRSIDRLPAEVAFGEPDNASAAQVDCGQKLEARGQLWLRAL